MEKDIRMTDATVGIEQDVLWRVTVWLIMWYIEWPIKDWLMKKKKAFTAASMQTTLQWLFSEWSVTVLRVLNLYIKLLSCLYLEDSSH